jgi:hypothetical protein
VAVPLQIRGGLLSGQANLLLQHLEQEWEQALVSLHMHGISDEAKASVIYQLKITVFQITCHAAKRFQ